MNGIAGDRAFHIPVVVLCELVWVRKSGYDLDRASIVDALERVLVTVQFTVASRDVVRQALSEYAKGPGDFADAIIGLTNDEAGCSSTATFDRALKKLPAFRLP